MNLVDQTQSQLNSARNGSISQNIQPANQQNNLNDSTPGSPLQNFTQNGNLFMTQDEGRRD
jgi:hypothetical protein